MKQDETVCDLLRRSAERLQDKIALVCGHDTLSYGELKHRVDCLTSKLHAFGVRKRDPFAVCLPNSIELVISFYGLAGLGAITTWINPDYAGEHFDFILSDSGARGIILDEGDDKYRQFRSPLKFIKRFPQLEYILSTSQIAGPQFPVEICSGGPLSQPVQTQVSPEDVCMIIYTSGATGIPKGAPATHRQVVRQAQVYTDALRVDEMDVFLAALPMFHSYGFISLLVQGIAVGGTLVIMKHWNAGEALRLIERNAVTVHMAAPTHYIMEMKHPDFEPHKMDSLRAGLISGYVPPEPLMDEIERRMGFHFCNFWGSSETGPGLISPWDAAREKRLFTVGRPIRGEEVRIVETGTTTEVPLGEMGELAVRGWNVLHAYWENPEETQRHFDSEGWFHTGDLAFMDREGYVTIMGRTKDQINRGGLKIVPYDLEKHLLEHPSVSSVAVVGTSNPVLGESICACVILRAGKDTNLRELREFLEPFVGKNALPDELVKVDQFPMLSGGVKINKYGPGGLREMAAACSTKEEWWKIKGMSPDEGSRRREP